MDRAHLGAGRGIHNNSSSGRCRSTQVHSQRLAAGGQNGQAQGGNGQQAASDNGAQGADVAGHTDSCVLEAVQGKMSVFGALRARWHVGWARVPRVSHNANEQCGNSSRGPARSRPPPRMRAALLHACMYYASERQDACRREPLGGAARVQQDWTAGFRAMMSGSASRRRCFVFNRCSCCRVP